MAEGKSFEVGAFSARRSEDQMRSLLSTTLDPPHYVRPSNTHGRNDCLTDSILLSLIDQNLLEEMTLLERSWTCQRIREHLEDMHGLQEHGPGDYPFLSHDEHFKAIMDYLRNSCTTQWNPVAQPERISFTLIVLDRFNRTLQPDVFGNQDEIIETEPVYAEAPSADSHECVTCLIHLYCNTHNDGTGYHYEWIHLDVAADDVAMTANETSPIPDPTQGSQPNVERRARTKDGFS